MKWEAIIEVEYGGFIEARCLGGPFPTEGEAVSWAIRYMELALGYMHRDRVEGKKFSPPWGLCGNRTAYPYDARCKNGIRTPPNCTLFT